MSTLPFRDVITLYHTVGEKTFYRIVPTVRCLVKESNDQYKREATVHIPLYGKRSLVYKTPREFIDSPSGAFTIEPGDKFICYENPVEDIPSSSFTVSEMTVHDHGSHRIRHIVIKGSIPLPPEAE